MPMDHTGATEIPYLDFDKNLWQYFLSFLIHLFLSAYIVWAISPACPLLSPLW
jgi:hypothetical protein